MATQITQRQIALRADQCGRRHGRLGRVVPLMRAAEHEPLERMPVRPPDQLVGPLDLLFHDSARRLAALPQLDRMLQHAPNLVQQHLRQTRLRQHGICADALGPLHVRFERVAGHENDRHRARRGVAPEQGAQVEPVDERETRFGDDHVGVP